MAEDFLTADDTWELASVVAQMAYISTRAKQGVVVDGEKDIRAFFDSIAVVYQRPV